MTSTILPDHRHRIRMSELLIVALLLLRAGSAQLPVAPRPQQFHPPNQQQSFVGEEYAYRLGWMCASGASTSVASTKPAFNCGAGLTLLPLPVFFEVGMMGPQANRSHFSAYISFDGSIPLAPPSTLYRPFAIVGYSRLFETGHALDYGMALAIPRAGKKKHYGDSIRIELRDYWTFANPSQHNVFLRFGLMSEESD